MTERSHGAPDPIDPSITGGAPVFPDLGAVRRSDAVVEALGARRAVRTAADDGDPAVRLLRALIADIDAGGALPRADRRWGLAAAPEAQPPRGPRRRGPRTIVALSVAGAVLTSTGVAAAGGGLVEQFIPGPSAEEKGGKASEAYEKSRAELRSAREALDQGNYDTARNSLDRARRDRAGLSGSQAIDLDKQIRDLEGKLVAARPDAPPGPRPAPRPSHPAPPVYGAPPPDDDAPLPARPPRPGKPPALPAPIAVPGLPLPPPGLPAPGQPVPGQPGAGQPDPEQPGSGDDRIDRRREEIRKRIRQRIDKYRGGWTR